MHDESLEQVQSKIAYLERAMSELSDVVFRQHKEIQTLEAQLKNIKERLEGSTSEETRPSAEEKPPHY
ncbi:MAG TPA: SlyX family protein [Steroidobacteraceae bacterium]